MDYLPLSMLNTLVYCERRYYLEHVEQVMAKNEYVEEGSIIHRNIVETAKPGRPYHKKDIIHTKSLAFSSINESDEYKIIGVIDLIEEKGSKVYPIEYKHGKKPTSDKVWENDAVQLCAEALLIEENLQISVDFGYLYYYRSRERIKVQFSEDLRQKTKKYICRAYELYQSKTIPPPLSDSPKCPGCSLFPICMPDEVGFLRKIHDSESPGLKNIHRVVPEQITGGVVYLQSKGGYVRKQGHHLVYFTEEEETKVPLEQISQVVVFGPIQLTTQTISVLLDLDIPTFFLSAKGRFRGALFPAPTRNSNLRLLQYRAFDNPEIKLLLSKEIVKAKILNTRTLYMRSLRNQEPEDQTQTESSGEVAKTLKQFSEAVERADSLDTLLGLEGAAARSYFSNFSKLLRTNTKELGFSFEHRNRRPPVDPVNALLSLAYSLLAKECFSAILTVGFDPYFGFYHGQRGGRPSLALDLMEEFRTVLADSVVLTLLNKQMLSLDDFIRWGQACYLSEMGRKKFFLLWETRKNTEVTHPVFRYKVCYSRVIEMQARMLAGYIKKDIPLYKAFTWR
jgi:CRISPR-associated protein Cas1